MTQYTNPELTQREIVEQSVLSIETMLDAIDDTAQAADAHRSEAIDYLTAQVISQHISVLQGSKYQLNAELQRLKNIIAVWNGDEPVINTTPTLPTTPLT